MWSIGSILHDAGECQPCAFLNTKGCESGAECLFCHKCPADEKKQRRKARRRQKGQAKQEAESSSSLPEEGELEADRRTGLDRGGGRRVFILGDTHEEQAGRPPPPDRASGNRASVLEQLGFLTVPEQPQLLKEAPTACVLDLTTKKITIRAVPNMFLGEEDFRAVFGAFGEIEEASVHTERGVCHLTFASPDAVYKCLKKSEKRFMTMGHIQVEVRRFRPVPHLVGQSPSPDAPTEKQEEPGSRSDRKSDGTPNFSSAAWWKGDDGWEEWLDRDEEREDTDRASSSWQRTGWEAEREDKDHASSFWQRKSWAPKETDGASWQERPTEGSPAAEEWKPPPTPAAPVFVTTPHVASVSLPSPPLLQPTAPVFVTTPHVTGVSLPSPPPPQPTAPVFVTTPHVTGVSLPSPPPPPLSQAPVFTPRLEAPAPVLAGPERHLDPTWQALFWKTKLCNFFATNSCTQGDSCSFAHGQPELRPLPDLRKTALCEEWMRGTCPLIAELCPYAHGPEELRTIMEEPSATWGGSYSWEAQQTPDEASHSIETLATSAEGSATELNPLASEFVPCALWTSEEVEAEHVKEAKRDEVPEQVPEVEADGPTLLGSRAPSLLEEQKPPQPLERRPELLDSSKLQCSLAQVESDVGHALEVPLPTDSEDEEDEA